ncbi:WLM domain containing protein [Novymonas esmeraldas]|uniref:WLM domain containing protein n=1 Tax=Novymonas esmeraldas TaxID=1808958 RepID=A0AAW0F3G5_9TRYP
MSSAFMAQLPCIGSSTTLGWQRDDVAQAYMEHILQRARVLLSRHGWHVGLIKEFYPRGASLLGLNVNAGSEVCIRFRVPGKKNDFLPFHEVLCTALHEFAHCVHSRHDRPFWNLYYDLVRECEALEVTMIQQGKQLYPVMSYTPAASTSAASSSSSSSLPPHASGRGRGRGAAGGSRRGTGGSSGIAGTRSRVGTHTATTTTLPRGGATRRPSAADGGIFPGEGRRLGGDGLRRYDVAAGFTPTCDALRRILAAAAMRRLRPPTAEETGVRGSSDAHAEGTAVTGDHDDDDVVPDCIPQHGSEDCSSGCWVCPRCGFRNETGPDDTCAFCADLPGPSDGGNHDDVGSAGGASLKRTRTEGSAVEQEVPRVEVPISAATAVPAARENLGTSREDAVVLSDDDDSS